MNSEEKKSIVESLIFASDSPLDLKALYHILNFEIFVNKPKTDNADALIKDEEVTDSFRNEILEIIELINKELESTGRPYQIVEFAAAGNFHQKGIWTFCALLLQIQT